MDRNQQDLAHGLAKWKFLLAEAKPRSELCKSETGYKF